MKSFKKSWTLLAVLSVVILFFIFPVNVFSGDLVVTDKRYILPSRSPVTMNSPKAQ